MAFNQNITVPEVSYADIQQFTADGIPIPVHERMLTGEIIPRSMSAPEVEQAMHDQALQEAELKKAEEKAAAGKALWDALMQGAIDFLSGKGMLKVEESKPEEVRHGGIDREQGRNKPVKIKNLRGEKPGYSMAEGSNFWSVDEKDPYWQTKQGYEEAINLYGRKPGWVKEPSLEYNPRTGKYDPIEKEEFVEIKPKKRISL